MTLHSPGAATGRGQVGGQGGAVMRWGCQHRGTDRPRGGHASEARQLRRRGVTSQSQNNFYFVPGNWSSYKYTTELATIIRQLPNGYPLDPRPIPFHKLREYHRLSSKHSANSPPLSSRHYPLTATHVRDGRPGRPAHRCSYRRPQCRHRMVRDREANPRGQGALTVL